MKKFKQLVSLTLSILMVFSCFTGLSAVGVSAAEDDYSVGADLAGNSDFFTGTSEESDVGATDGLNITATSNLFPDSYKAVSKTELSGKDNLVTVSYYINNSKRLLDFDWELSFDSSLLEFSEDENYDEDYNQKIMPQVSGDVVLNTKNAGRILCNYSSTSAKTKLTNNGEFVPFVTVTFKAIGSGDATVDLSVKDLRICNIKDRVADTDTIEWVVREGEVNNNLETPGSYATAAYAGTYTTYTEPEEVVTTVPKTTATQPIIDAEGVYVNATSNLFPGKAKSFSDSQLIPAGSLVTVSYYANCAKRLLDFDWELSYDSDILEFAEDENFDEDYNQLIMPQVSGDVVINTNTAGKILCNYSSSNAKTKLTNNGQAVPFVTVVFKVRKAGNADVNLKIKDLRICDIKDRLADPDTIEWVVRESSVNSNTDTPFLTATDIFVGKGGEVPEITTQKPGTTTVPKTTTEPIIAAEGVYVNATSNLFPGKAKSFSDSQLIPAGNFVTVTYYANCAKRLLDFDWELDYDKDILEFVEDENFDDDYNQLIMPQVSGDVVINTNTAGKILCNYSSSNAKTKLTNNGQAVPFVTVVFKVRKPGNANVNLKIKDLRICDIKDRLADPDTIEWIVRESSVNSNTETPFLTATDIFAGKGGEVPEITTQKPGTTTVPKTTTEPIIAAEGVYVNATSNLFPATAKSFSDSQLIPAGNFVTVTYYANCAKRLLDFDCELSYDSDILEFVEDYNFDEDYNQKIMPQVSGDVVLNTGTTGKILCNFSSSNAKTKLTNNGQAVPFVTVVFKVRKAGNATVNLKVKDLRICDIKDRLADPDTIEWVVRESVANTSTATPFLTSTDITVGTAGGEVPEITTTTAKTTTQPILADGLYIKADSNLFPSTTKTISKSELIANNNYVTVTFFANCEKRLLDFDWELEYDPTMLEFDADKNFDEDYNQKIMPQVSGDVVLNTNTPGRLLCNFSSSLAKTKLTNNGEKVPFVTVIFKVLKDGNATVDLKVKDLRICDVKNRVADTDTIEWIVRESVYQTNYTTPFDRSTVITVGSGEPVTVPGSGPSTVPDTTVTVPDDNTVYVVAGTPNLTGYNWNGAIDTGNDMKKQGSVYTFTFEGVESIGEEMQIKIVANNDNGQTWIGDKYGQNVTFTVTKVTDVTITYNPATQDISVTGDGVEMITELKIDSMRIAGAADDAKGNWLNGISWDPAADANVMSKVAGNVYQIEFKNLPEEMGYEFKIAANGSWNANWGIDDTTTVEFDKAFQSKYNGNNVKFDLDEDSDVTITIDLRNFVYATKTGATITIDVVPAGEEPATTKPVPTTTKPVPTTTKPVPTTTKPVPTTTKPVPTTTQPVSTTAPVTTKPVQTDGLNIKADSNLFPSAATSASKAALTANNNYVTVTYFANCAKRLLDFDWELEFDPTMLEFVEEYNFDEDYNQQIMPQVSGDLVLNTSTAGRILCNFSSTLAKTKLTNNGEKVPFVRITFKVLKNGSTTVNLKVKDLRICDLKNRVADTDTIEWVVRESVYQSNTATPFDRSTEIKLGGATDEPVIVSEPTTTQPVPTTTKPVPTTTKPVPTTTKPEPTTAQSTTMPRLSRDKIYFEVPSSWGEVKWNTKHTQAAVYCHTASIYNDAEYPSYVFASKNERCNYEFGNVFSFDPGVQGTLKDDADYTVIFVVDNTEGYRFRTCEITFNKDCYGDVVKVTGGTRVNRGDQQVTDYLGNWNKKNHKEKYGPLNIINDMGAFTGGTYPVNMPKEKMITDRLYDSAFKMNANAKFFTTAKLNELAKTLGVDVMDVYDSYVKEYGPIVAEKTASGELKDTYNDVTGEVMHLVPTTERVADRLGIDVAGRPVNDGKIYFEVPASWGTVKWNSKHTMAAVYCHLYKVYNGPDLTSYTFASKNERCEWVRDNIYCYDTSLVGEIVKGADYSVIFCVDTVEGPRYQTCDTTMGYECLGDTLRPTGATRVNSIDSEKTDYVAAWSYGPNAEKFGEMSIIDSLANLLPGKLPYYMPRTKMIADKLFDPGFNMKVNAKYFTTERLNELEAALGVTAMDVYKMYKKTYSKLLEERIASGELVDQYNEKTGAAEFLVPTLERVAERLGLNIENRPYGDVNLDGVIDIKDATAIQKHIAGFELLSGDGLKNADVDLNGEVDVNDVTLIRKYVAFMIDSFD